MADNGSKKHGGQNFLQGAAILGVAMVLVKVIGAVFKIPLANIIGTEGMGYFGTAYSLFTPIYAVSVAGLPAAIARIVAEKSAAGDYRDVVKIRRLSRLAFLIIGTIGFLIIAVFAGIFTTVVGNPGAKWAVISIAPAAFFGCMMAAYRGYYEGLRNMFPTAISQVVEVFVKLIAGLGLSIAAIKIGQSQYAATGKVFFVTIEEGASANDTIMMFAAAAAVLGISLSTVAGFLYVFIRFRIKGDGITKGMYNSAPRSSSSKQLLTQLLFIAIPISLSSLVINLSSLIDNISLMTQLRTALERGYDTVMQMYPLIPDSIKLDKIPNYIYGAYTGQAVTMFNLIPAFTIIFGKSALPNVAAAWASKDMAAVKVNIESSVRITNLIAIPAGFGLSVMAEPVLKLLYRGEKMAPGVQIAAPVLSMMGIAVICLAITVPAFNVLQALGHTILPIVFMSVGAVLKLMLNFILVGIPSINLKGAAVGNFVCYFLIVILCMIALKKITGIKLGYFGIFGRPLIAGAACALTAWASYGLITRFVTQNQLISAIVPIALGFIVYLIVILLIKGIAKDDVLMLPKGKNIAKTLEKYRLIG